MTREVCPGANGDGNPVEADSGYENEKDGGGKMNIQEENLGVKKRGKKVVGTFDLYVPVKTPENKLGFGLIEYKLIIYYSGYLVVILSEQ